MSGVMGAIMRRKRGLEYVGRLGLRRSEGRVRFAERR